MVTRQEVRRSTRRIGVAESERDTRSKAAPSARSTSTTWPPPQPSAVALPPAHPPVFAHYYLWWGRSHWRAELGAAYPLTAGTAPLPASLDADGCGATPSFPGDTLVDVPALPLGTYSQDDPATMATHVSEAARAGIDGFVVSWSGTGAPAQDTGARDFNRRLDLLVKAVDGHNAHATKPFSLMLGYQGLDNARATRDPQALGNDLAYFAARYAADPAFRVARYGPKPVVMVLDSRRFPPEVLRTALAPVRSRLTLIGDEHGLADWNRGVSDVFDGDGWYWSCVPRRDGATLRAVYALNSGSHPDGWMYISWNEFLENTYVEPSVRYGSGPLDQLAALLR